MEAIAKSDEGQMRIARATVRIDRTVAELGEKDLEGREHVPVAQGESEGDVVRGQVVDDRNPFELPGRS